MSDDITTVTWIAMLAGAAGMLFACWRLRQGSPAGGGRNGQLAAMLFGLVVLLNTVPRLAGASSGVVLILSTLALLPLTGFVVLLTRAART